MASPITVLICVLGVIKTEDQSKVNKSLKIMKINIKVSKQEVLKNKKTKLRKEIWIKDKIKWKKKNKSNSTKVILQRFVW